MQVKSQHERLDIPNTEEEERRPIGLIGMRHTAAGLIYEMLDPQSHQYHPDEDRVLKTRATSPSKA